MRYMRKIIVCASSAPLGSLQNEGFFMQKTISSISGILIRSPVIWDTFYSARVLLRYWLSIVSFFIFRVFISSARAEFWRWISNLLVLLGSKIHCLVFISLVAFEDRVLGLFHIRDISCMEFLQALCAFSSTISMQ